MALTLMTPSVLMELLSCSVLTVALYELGAVSPTVELCLTWCRVLLGCHNKHHRLGALNNRGSFSQFWGLEVQKRGVSKVGFILSPLFLA